MIDPKKCPYPECKQRGRCQSPMFDALCWFEKVERGKALADAWERERADQQKGRES